MPTATIEEQMLGELYSPALDSETIPVENIRGPGSTPGAIC